MNSLRGWSCFALVSLSSAGIAADSASAPEITHSPLKEMGSWLGGASALSEDTVVAGLKAGLATGVDRAMAELGRPNGFLQNAAFKVLLPPELAKAEKTLRRLKQDQMVDDLIAAMNQAAEQSVGETVPIFKEAINAMSLSDALAILKGPPDAATSYFRHASETALRTKMLPLVKKATDANGVGAMYKQVSGQAAPLTSLFGVKSVDLDAYVCDHALGSLFTVIATQEAALRANPKAAASKLIERVFSRANPPRP